jgi:hypothetical protein
MKRMIPSSVGIVMLCPLLFLLSCGGGSQQSTDRSADSLAVSQAIHACIGWAKEKDFKLLYSVIANDPGYLEVSPGNSITRGIDEFKENELFWGSSDFRAIRYDIRDLVISFSPAGDAAWFYCVLDDINEWKGQPASWENTRWTGVLVKKEGRWIMMQQHFSFANSR